MVLLFKRKLKVA